MAGIITSILAIVIPAEMITFVWKPPPNEDCITGYRVYLTEQQGAYSNVPHAEVPTNTYSVSLKEGVHYIRVSTMCGKVEGNWSTEKTILVEDYPPGPPGPALTVTPTPNGDLPGEPTATPTETVTPLETETPTATPTESPTVTPWPTLVPTRTKTPKPSATPLNTPTKRATFTPLNTKTPTHTFTPKTAPTLKPTSTPNYYKTKTPTPLPTIGITITVGEL